MNKEPTRPRAAETGSFQCNEDWAKLSDKEFHERERRLRKAFEELFHETR